MHTVRIIALITAVFFLTFPTGAQQSENEIEIPLAGSSVHEENQKITLKLKNMDILEVFNILAERGNLNIIAGNNVRGRVTLFLKDVDVWDAFRFVTELNGLAYIRENNIIRVLTENEYQALYGSRFHQKTELRVFPAKYADIVLLKATIEGIKSQIGKVLIDENSNSLIVIDEPDSIDRIEETIQILDKPLITRVFQLAHATPSEIEPYIKNELSKRGSIVTDTQTNKILVTDVQSSITPIETIISEYDKKPALLTEIFELQYAKYDEIKEKLESEITQDIGYIQADERTNKIAITDLPEKMIVFRKIINAFDEKNREVIIEARILQIRLSDSFKFGINWQSIITEFQNRNLNFNISQVFDQFTDTSLTDTSPFDARKPRSAQIVATGIAEGGRDGIGNPYEVIVDVLKELGDVKIISTPRICALNNEEASIQVGTNQAYVTNTVVQNTSNATTAENVNFIKVGIMLKVTPKINRNSFITMDIEPEVSSVAEFLKTSTGNEIPIVRTSNAKTSIMVKDGTTIIIGGLIEKTKSKTVSKVPILGSIPIIGMLFKRISNSEITNELVIFLTPHIITGEVTDPEYFQLEEELQNDHTERKHPLREDIRDVFQGAVNQ